MHPHRRFAHRRLPSPAAYRSCEAAEADQVASSQVKSSQVKSAANAQEEACASSTAQAVSTFVSNALGTAFDVDGGGRSVHLTDTTGQRQYYVAEHLHGLIDVALVWKPGHQQGNAAAVNNRPPTRLNWWFSHGLPAIGYPMVAYLEASHRANYPTQLLNLTRAVHVQHALCSLGQLSVRHCLRERALHGAAISSPQYSARELVAALCVVAQRCAPGGRLKLVAHGSRMANGRGPSR